MDIIEKKIEEVNDILNKNGEDYIFGLISEEQWTYKLEKYSYEWGKLRDLLDKYEKK